MSGPSIFEQVKDTGQLLAQGGPGVCNISITNVCNARCDFCNYAYDKPFVTDKRFVDFDELCEAIDILYERGVRYLTFSGGEPFLHPRLRDMVEYSVKKHMRPSVVTNGYMLIPKMLEELKKCGLKTLFISIDAATAEAHEANRGLPGVCERIKEANVELKRMGLKTVASVCVSKLIKDYGELVKFLEYLGFETVTFAYPKRALGSSSLVFSEVSSLVDFTPQELTTALGEIKKVKRHLGVLNPEESLSEMIRHVRKEEQMFPCYGGYRYFFLDSKLDVYRCDYLATKLGTIQEFRTAPFIRDNCTACMSTCYRDSSVLLHFAVSIGDAVGHLKKGQVGSAAKDIFTRSNVRSVKALIGEWGTLQKLAKRV